MTKRILVPLGNGFEELEAISVIDVLRRTGCEVVIASLNENLEVISQGKVKIIAQMLLSQIQVEDFDGVVLPGGWEGTQNFIASSQLSQIIHELKNQNKIIAAICAAPFALFKMGILGEKNFTCYPGIEKMIDNPNYTQRNVVVDGNLITSRGPATALEFALHLGEVFAGKEKAKEVGEGMLKF